VKTLLAAGSVLALGALVYGGRTWLAAAPVPDRVAEKGPRTRIALVNLTYVIKNYEKFKTFQTEIKEAFEPFQKSDRDRKQEAEVLSKQLQDGNLAGKQRADLEKKLKDLQRAIEDNNAAAKEVLQKKGDEQMKILYMDVSDAAERHAKAHDFELVLHYNDATTREDFLSAPNIARKLQAGALTPLYAVPGLDISKQIVEALNEMARDK
jgi:outer membrane protein